MFKNKFILDRVVPFVLIGFLLFAAVLLLYTGSMLTIAHINEDRERLFEMSSGGYPLDGDVSFMVNLYVIVLSSCCLFLSGIYAYFFFDFIKPKKR